MNKPSLQIQSNGEPTGDRDESGDIMPGVPWHDRRMRQHLPALRSYP
jgi:hypothetical protein